MNLTTSRPTAPFPDSNYGAAVYFSPPNRPDQWSFLGMLVLSLQAD